MGSTDEISTRIRCDPLHSLGQGVHGPKGLINVFRGDVVVPWVHAGNL